MLDDGKKSQQKKERVAYGVAKPVIVSHVV
jgi:hypothetical protein